MGPSNRMQEEQEDRRLAAIAISIAACVLRTCPDHSDIVFSVEDSDLQEAYKFGKTMWQAGNLRDFFESQRQMRDCIKAAVAEHQLRRCPVCEPTPPH